MAIISVANETLIQVFGLVKMNVFLIEIIKQILFDLFEFMHSS